MCHLLESDWETKEQVQKLRIVLQTCLNVFFTRSDVTGQAPTSVLVSGANWLLKDSTFRSVLKTFLQHALTNHFDMFVHFSYSNILRWCLDIFLRRLLPGISPLISFLQSVITVSR